MDENNLNLMVEMSSFFSNKIRLAILMHLLKEGESCVSKIVKSLEIKQNTVSNQLKILKLGRIIKARKSGNKIFYSLSDAHISNLLMALSEHSREELHD